MPRTGRPRTVEDGILLAGKKLLPEMVNSVDVIYIHLPDVYPCPFLFLGYPGSHLSPYPCVIASSDLLLLDYNMLLLA